MKKERWLCDVRNGCIAVYFDSDYHKCLSGAHEWARAYFHGHRKELNGYSYWEVSKLDVLKAEVITFWLNFTKAKPRDIYA